MGRDVGRDEGREQAEWRDLVARLELPGPVDPADAPWPDRENLRGKTEPGGASQAGTQTPDGTASADTDHSATEPGDPARRDTSPSENEPTEPLATDASTQANQASQASQAKEPGTSEPTLGGPRDYELDEPRDADLAEDWDDRYIPPALPPQPGLDPIAKGAWLALFGGPGYLLVATLLGWQIPGWGALAAVIAFVAGFVVLVFRLGDGPSKRDGPDQGAVV